MPLTSFAHVHASWEAHAHGLPEFTAHSLRSPGLSGHLGFILTESEILTLAQSLSYICLSLSHLRKRCSAAILEHQSRRRKSCPAPTFPSTWGRTVEHKLLCSLKGKQENQSYCGCLFNNDSGSEMQLLNKHYQGEREKSKKILMVSQDIQQI